MPNVILTAGIAVPVCVRCQTSTDSEKEECQLSPLDSVERPGNLRGRALLNDFDPQPGQAHLGIFLGLVNCATGHAQLPGNFSFRQFHLRACFLGRKHLENIAAAVAGGLGPEAAAKVGYYTPDEFLAELQKLAKTAEVPPPSGPMAKSSKILGFEITRNFPKQSPEEQRLNQQAIHEVTRKALKP